MTDLHPFLREMRTMLVNLDAWLAKAIEHAKAKGFDPDVLAQARLAPDQFPLARQVQAACDSAKLAAARLAGKEAPAHPDEEKTLDELRARIGKATAFLDGLTREDFAGAAQQTVRLPFLPGDKGAVGLDYFIGFAQPNFFFHVTTAYAILRHNGVSLGKRDFIGDGLRVIDL